MSGNVTTLIGCFISSFISLADAVLSFVTHTSAGAGLWQVAPMVGHEGKLFILWHLQGQIGFCSGCSRPLCEGRQGEKGQICQNFEKPWAILSLKKEDSLLKF